MACLGAGSGSLRSQERLAANLAASHEVGGLPARIQIFEPNWGRLPDGAKHARDLTKARDATNAKVRDLIEERIPERIESARLSIELAEAKAEGAEIKEVSRQQEALLTALMAVLATRARHDAIVRSENADMRQRLEAVQAELQRKVLENSRLAAELAAAHKAADSATMGTRRCQVSPSRAHLAAGFGSGFAGVSGRR
jgi:regulator of replication initiation timing